MIGTVLSVVLHQELWQQQIQNKLHFRVNELMTSELTEMADAFDAFVTSHWAPTVTGDLKFKLIRVTAADGSSEDVYERVPTTIAGTNSGSNTNPSQVAGILSIRSNTTNRKRNGRIYVGGLVNRQPQIDGKVNAMTLSELTALGAGLLDVFSGMPTLDDFTFGVYSRAKEPPEVNTPQAAIFTAAEAIRVNPIYGTQRKRRIGTGA